MATGNTPITAGDATGGRVATYTGAEDAVTKELQRVGLNRSDLTELIGTAADSASLPVALSTEGKAQLGSLTETAPATDTASSGLNGRLQRIAQNLSSILSSTTPSPVKIDQTTPGTTNLVAAGLVAGAAKVGIVTTDQTTHGTTDLVASDNTKIAGTAIATGNGTVSAGVQRVAIASDNSNVPVTSASLGFDVATTITRPANTTAYTANDVLGGALDLGVLGTSAAAVQIVGVQLEADITAIPAGQTSWVLYLYNVTPPSAIADNGAWDLPSGDRASFLGSLAITTLVDLGSTLYVEANNIFKQLRLSGTHVFGYLVTVGGFTPAANSEVYKLTLHTMVI